MIGVLYDVHGNLPALEAVLGEARECGVERFVLGGDYALAGGWPLETVELLHTLDAVWIRGNTDRWLGDDSEDAPDVVRPLIARCRELLGDGLAAKLATLQPDYLESGVRFCHGSPGSDMIGFDRESNPADAELLAGIAERRLVFGHTHVAFEREAGGVALLNPGSVGAPWDGDHRAAWAILATDGTPERRRTEYDWGAAATAIRTALGEAAELSARRIEQARFMPE